MNKSYLMSYILHYQLVDGSWLYGETADFEVGNSEWHTRLLQVNAEQVVSLVYKWMNKGESPLGVPHG